MFPDTGVLYIGLDPRASTDLQDKSKAKIKKPKQKPKLELQRDRSTAPFHLCTNPIKILPACIDKPNLFHSTRCYRLDLDLLSFPFFLLVI